MGDGLGRVEGGQTETLLVPYIYTKQQRPRKTAFLARKACLEQAEIAGGTTAAGPSYS